MKHFTTITFGVSFALAAMSYAAPDDPKPAPKAAPKLADQSGDLSGIYACSGTEASGKKYNGVTSGAAASTSCNGSSAGPATSALACAAAIR